jgi:acyl-coenzyme A synthetase/AMP-(fatty) acid ligase
LTAHPFVLEAAVIGRQGADNEETVIAFVVPREAVQTGDLLAHCRIRLTPHKVPRQIHVVGQLPRNTAGKVDKMALARLLG